MRSYVRCYTGEPGQFEYWINRHCEEENVRVTAMTAIPGGYGTRIIVAFETIKERG